MSNKNKYSAYGLYSNLHCIWGMEIFRHISKGAKSNKDRSIKSIAKDKISQI